MLGLGDDQRHRLADEADAVVREAGPERNAQRAAADALEEGQDRRRFPARRHDVGAGDDIDHARRVARGVDINFYDFCVCAVSAQKDSSSLMIKPLVAGVLPAAGNKPMIFSRPLNWCSANCVNSKWRSEPYDMFCHR